ncbi:MAG TPA: cache domain-containing protein [Holophagaceae bacterium]
MTSLFRPSLLLVLTAPLFADGAGMLKECISMYYAQGASALIKEANGGKFHASPSGYLVVLDETGKVLVHGESSRFIGVNLSNFKDAQGHAFFKEALEARDKGRGRVSFVLNQGGAQVRKTLLWDFQAGVMFAWISDDH